MATNDDGLVLFSGYAKLPVGITASEMYKVIGLVLVVDEESGEILDADCTLATEVARKHVAKLIVGYSLNQSPEKLVRAVDQAYQGSAKKAIITAIRIIYDKYRSYKEGVAPSVME